MAGYLLLAPPAFVLGPLAGLLLLSSPRTAREWIWIVMAGGASLFWIQLPGQLALQTVRTAAVLLTGAYLALTLWRQSASFSRALQAAALAGAGLAALAVYTGVSWGELQQAVTFEFRAIERAVPAEYQGQVPPFAETAAMLFPALLTLIGIAGVRLAWAWHYRLAEHPLGKPDAPFKAFRFSDQAVWGWVAALALYLLHLPNEWSALAVNLLLVLAVLYAARGLAVFAAGAGRVPPPLVAVLTLVAMVLLPFVVGGLTLLGLADTWLDFRRRSAAPATGGFDL